MAGSIGLFAEFLQGLFLSLLTYGADFRYN